MPLFSDDREEAPRLGFFSPMPNKSKLRLLDQAIAEKSPKSKAGVSSNRQLELLDQVIAEREAGIKTPSDIPTWGETLTKAPASGLASVNVGLARLARDTIKIADMPASTVRKAFGIKGERPDVKFLEDYMIGQQKRQEVLDVSEKLSKLPHWHPKRILGTGLQAIPQVAAVAGGALMGAPFIGGATAAATMLGAIAYGPSAEEAKAEGANEIQQILHGITSAQIEVLTELPVFRAVGQIWKHLKGAGVAKKAGVSFAKKLLTGLGLYGKGLALETTQEVEAYLGGQISKRLHYDPNATINFKDAVEAGYGGLAMAATIGIAGVPAMGVRAAAKTPETRQKIIEAEMPTPMTTISEETTNLASVKPSPMRAFGMREKPIEPIIEPAPTDPKTDVALEPEGVEIPTFKSTQEAYAFGEKAIPEQVDELKRLSNIQDVEYEKFKKAGKLQEAMDAAVKGQFYHEALQKVEGTEEYKKFKPEKAVVGEKVEKVEVPEIVKPKLEEKYGRFLEKVGKRLESEAIGQDILDTLEEKKIRPSSVSKTFWKDTFFKLPSEAQNNITKYLTSITGIKPGDVIATLKGKDIKAKDWFDIANMLGDDFTSIEYLEGTERGYIALMAYANEQIKIKAAKPLPSKLPKAKPSEAVREEIKGEGIPEVAPIHIHKPTIKTMVESYKRRDPDIMARPIAMIKKEGKITVLEGEHRFVAAKEAGVEPPMILLTEKQTDTLDASEIDALALKRYGVRADGTLFGENTKELKDFYTQAVKPEITIREKEIFIPKHQRDFFLLRVRDTLGLTGKQLTELVNANKSKIDETLRKGIKDRNIIGEADKFVAGIKKVKTIPEVKPKPEKEKVEVTPKKEPWGMNREEYRNELSRLWDEIGNNDVYINLDFVKYSENVPHEYFNESMKKYSRTTDQKHYRAVKQAISEGKKIPPEVLKDYPDLRIEEKLEVETTPEGKEISVDLTKKEEAAVTLKQQKEYLLAEIDKAIESGLKESEFEGSLEEARELRKGRYSLNPLTGVTTNYKFEVPNDGTFEIAGSALFEFQDRVKSAFPSTITSKKFKSKAEARKAVPTAKYNKILGKSPKELKPADIDRIFKEVADTETRDITGPVLLNPFQNWLLSQDITKAVKDKIRSVAGKDYIEEARVKFETQDIEYARSMVEYTRGGYEESQSYYSEYEAGEKTLKQIAEETGVKRSGRELAEEASEAKSAYYKAVEHLEQLEKPTGVKEPARVRDEKAFATKATKPQDTITRADLKSIFGKMKNVMTGQDKDGNFFFKTLGRPKVTIYEVNHIEGYINTSKGRIPVGSYLGNTIELKTGGEGYTADIGTAWHEFEHWMEANNILSGNDIKALDAVLEKQGITPNTETRATYVGDRLSVWQSQKNLRIRRVLKKIADFVNSIWEFVSRTRTARGVLADVESGKALGKKAKATETVGELAPMYQMAGTKAIGAPTGQLVKAQEMLAEGKNKKEVWRETGWMKGAEGKYRFEIDDSGAELSEKKLNVYGLFNGKLSAIFKHPKLFKAYLELKQLDFKLTVKEGLKPFEKMGGSFGEKRINVIAESMEEAKSTLLHELQHAIQEIEGFAKGGAPEQFATKTGVLKPATRGQVAIFFGLEPSGKVYLKEGGAITKDKLGLIEQDKQLFFKEAPGSQYQRLAGEIEARSVAARAKLTPKQRREQMPYESQGIPEDQWIITDGKGTSFSVEEPKVFATKPAKKLTVAEKMLGIRKLGLKVKSITGVTKKGKKLIKVPDKDLEIWNEIYKDMPKPDPVTHAQTKAVGENILRNQELLDKLTQKLYRGQFKGLSLGEVYAVRKTHATYMNKFEDAFKAGTIEEINQKISDFRDEGIGRIAQAESRYAGQLLNAHKISVAPQAILNAFAGVERTIRKQDIGMYEAAKKAQGNGNDKPMIEFIKYLKETKGDPKLMDYVYEYWYNCILSGIPTHIVNVASNTTWAAWQIGIHKPLLAAIDPLVARFQKRPTEYYIDEIIPALAGIKRGLRPGLRGAKEVIIKGYTTEAITDKFVIEMGKSMGAFSRSPNKYLRIIAPFISFPTRTLRSMDIWAKQMNFQAELGNIAKRMEKQGKGVYEDILKNPTEVMMNQASEYADYTTFMNKLGTIGSTMESIRSDVPGGRFVVPFVRTIANLVKRGVEMTPGIGALKFLGGKVKGPEATQVLVKQIEGAIIMTVIALMFIDDEITGDAPANKAEREAFYRQGKKPWAIKIGDRWLQYRRIEPFNTPIASVGILYDTWKRTGKTLSTELAWRCTAGLVNNIIDSSYLSGLTQVLDSVRKADKWPQKLTNMFDRTIASFSPISSFQRSFVRAIEALGKKGAVLRKPKGAVETLAAATPFASKLISARKNVWGEDIVIYGSPLEQWLPWKTAKVTEDAVEIEIERLHEVGSLSYPGMPAKYTSIKGKRIDFDDEQYDKLITESGKDAKKKLNRLVDTHYFKRLSDKGKASRIKRIIADSRKKSRNKLKRQLGGKPIPGMVPWKTKEKPAWQKSMFGKKSAWQKSRFTEKRF